MTCKIAIDLTPIRSGGENGGAKTLTWQLLTHFKELVPNYTFLLLTAEWNHDELSVFDNPDFTRLCVLSGSPSSPSANQARLSQTELLQSIRRHLPLSLIHRLRPAVHWMKRKAQSLKKPLSHQPRSTLNLADRGVDLLFCPFTAVTYAEPGLPTISFIHDLQHRIYPQFFDPVEIAGREQSYGAAALRADYFICNSNFTRQTLLDQFSNIQPDQTYVIPIAVHTRLKRGEVSSANLPSRPYLFYPANYWPHKNHRLLLTAYNALRHQRPDLNLDLVFTGAPSPEEEKLKTAVSKMGLTNHVHFLGFLPDHQLAAVFQSSRAIIYPSLYEGFGIPLLEAFTFNKPVLCSNTTSLPEVAASAALYFNPRKPMEIIDSIESLLDTHSLEAKLIQAGQERLAHYNAIQMVQQYREIFDHAVYQKPQTANTFLGQYEDGWLGLQATFTYREHNTSRCLVLVLLTPSWHPYPAVNLTFQHPETNVSTKITLPRGQTTTQIISLPQKGGHFTLNLSPAFQPAKHEGTADTRFLTTILQSWYIE